MCRGSLETLVCGMQLRIDKFWLRSGSRLVCRQRLASLAAQHTTGCVTDQPCFRPRSLSAPNLSLHLTANLICTCLGWLITRGSLTISISFDQQMATIDSALAPCVNKNNVKTTEILGGREDLTSASLRHCSLRLRRPCVAEQTRLGSVEMKLCRPVGTHRLIRRDMITWSHAGFVYVVRAPALSQWSPFADQS